MENTIIVVAGLSELTDSEFVDNVDLKADGVIANPGVVPNIDPDGTDVKTSVTEMKKEMTERDLLLNQAQQKTSNIQSMRKEITKTMTGKWANQIQNAPGIDQGKVELLNFKVKGTTERQPPEPDNLPVIINIDINVKGQHTLNIISGKSKKKGLPYGIDRVDIYGQTGGNMPANLAELITNGGTYLGEAVKGKFINVFTNQKSGVPQFYIAVYILKKTKKIFSQGPVANAMITV
jgi:hypothetical protein